MKNRSVSYYRHQRERNIKRKEFIAKHILQWDTLPIRGKFNKGKIHCSCWMCKFEKHFDISKANVKAKADAMKEEIKCFYNREV